jgi:hypothetical protein
MRTSFSFSFHFPSPWQSNAQSLPLVAMLSVWKLTGALWFLLAPTVPGGAPVNFSAQGMSSTSVKLSWHEPEKAQRNGEITMYEISYYKTSDPTQTYDVNSTTLNKIIEGLDMNSDYLFQIKAYTSQGAGPWSARLPVRTFGQCKSHAQHSLTHSCSYSPACQ